MGGQEVIDDPNDDGTIPAVPNVRSITPAPEDFASPPSLPTFLWPTIWTVILGALVAWGLSHGWS